MINLKINSKEQPVTASVIARGPGGMIDGREVKMYVNILLKYVMKLRFMRFVDQVHIRYYWMIVVLTTTMLSLIF